jgi:hypothetical protein
VDKDATVDRQRMALDRARCLACPHCRRLRFIATTDRWCWPNEVDASAYSRAVPKNSVVRQSAETTGRHELRTGPGFDDPLACGVRTVGVVWIVDEQQRWIVGAGRNSEDVGVKQRQSEAPVKTPAQTFAYPGSEPMTVGKRAAAVSGSARTPSDASCSIMCLPEVREDQRRFFAFLAGRVDPLDQGQSGCWAFVSSAPGSTLANRAV